MQIKSYALERVLRLDFYHQQELDLLITQAIPLLQEHLRLVWHWATYLDVSSRWPTLIYSGLAHWVTLGTELDENTEQILSARKYPTLWVRQTLRNYLLWSAVEENPKVKECNLASPYEPLIRLYEGNGFLAVENGILIVVAADGQTSISQNSELYERSEPFVVL